MRCLPALFLSVATITLVAQAPPRRPAAIYDAAQEATFEGTILEVTQVAAGTRRGGGTHILLKTPAGDTEIRLGPSRFLSRQGMTLAKGDKVSVVGAKTGAGKDAYVIAREITANGKTVALRDKAGVPSWSRGRS